MMRICRWPRLIRRAMSFTVRPSSKKVMTSWFLCHQRNSERLVDDINELTLRVYLRRFGVMAAFTFGCLCCSGMGSGSVIGGVG